MTTNLWFQDFLTNFYNAGIIGVLDDELKIIKNYILLVLFEIFNSLRTTIP